MKLASWSSNVQLSIWAWFAVVLYLSPTCVSAIAAGSSTHDPSLSLRAALVSVVRESDLTAILTSINQLEDAFNSEYHYDWVFFSSEPLSNTFHARTSNATRASCLYEVSRENWRASVASSA